MVLRQVIFRNGSSGVICNPYRIEALSTKFVQGFPGLATGRAYDKDTGAITRVFRFHNDIHDFHHAQHWSCVKPTPLMDLWLQGKCADRERSTQPGRQLLLHIRAWDGASREAVRHRVCGSGPVARSGKAPALRCTQSVSGSCSLCPARVWECSWGGEPTGRACAILCWRPKKKPSGQHY